MTRLLLITLLLATVAYAASPIQERLDISGNWQRINPVLAQGQRGLEIDTGQEKIGTGQNEWNTLPYWRKNNQTFDGITKIAFLNMTGFNAGIEIGNVHSVNTPYADFHSSGNNIDYDSRIYGFGGTPVIGNGYLGFNTAGNYFNALISVPSLLMNFPNAAIDIGQYGASNTPYINFHSGTVGVPYDASILASGGTGVNGGGTLIYTAGTHIFAGGAVSISNQIQSTLATGNAPFTVVSTTPVANLSIGGNAATASSVLGGITFTNISTAMKSGKSADSAKLNGQSASFYQPVSTAITTSNIGSQAVYSASTAAGLYSTPNINVGIINANYMNLLGAPYLQIGDPAIAATTMINFLTSGNAVLFDSRIQASGGTSSIGNGTLTLYGTTSINGGSNIVYRCTGATNLGMLTINNALCVTGYATTSLKID